MNPVYQSAFLKALGWSLIDSLWQMGAVWFLYVLLTGSGKKSSPSFRYSLALIALAIGIAGFFVSLFLHDHYPGREFSIFTNPSFLADYIPLLSASYLIIASFYVARWIHQYLDNRNLLKEVKPARMEALYLINQLKHITSLTREIKIFCSSKIFTPLTTGFIKPVIFLPVAALTQLSTRQIEALIVHEFFHIKRNDYLVNLLTSFAESFLFFNPFAKLLLKNIHHERENCCDDEVIRLGYDRWEYAHALYTLSKNGSQQFGIALAATGNGKHLLLARIKRLLNTGTTGYPIKKPLSIFFLCLLAAGTLTKEGPPDKKLPPAVAVLSYAALSDSKVTALIKSEPPVIFLKKKIKTKKAEQAPTVSALSIPPAPPAPENIQSGENHAFYISSNVETQEFSMLEPPVSSTQKPEDLGPGQPFVSASTFYFPTHEISLTVNGKTTIHL